MIPRPGWLVVFGKAAEPGGVKTRLCPPLSPEEAAELYGCLLADALEESARAAASLGLEAVLAFDPPELGREAAVHAPAGYRVIAQRGSDLGARMSQVVRQAAAARAGCVLLRGSDSPTLDAAGLAAARAALDEADLVARPDPDGGYDLVGLAGLSLARAGGPPGVFDHPMSTSTVLGDTTTRAERLGLRIRLLGPGFDVDRYEDLDRLARARREANRLPCPRTLAFLDRRRLWPPSPADLAGRGDRTGRSTRT